MPTKARFLADFTLGFADGLTVPFALTAGLSSLGRTDTVVYAGVAEICAGSISMGISGYLSARGDGAVTSTESRMTDDDEDGDPEDAEKGVSSLLSTGVVDYLRPLELPPALFDVVVDHVRGRPGISETLADMSEREEEDPRSPVVVGLSVSLGYMLGGILPLFPYFVVERVGDGLFWSFGICLVALFAFGFIKDFVLSHQRREKEVRQGRFGKKQGVQWADVRRSSWEGLQMVLLGGVAALAAVLCVRAFEGLREASGDATA
ncbi:Ccc1 family [Coniochaeta sp. 2T2.1]|nr:Ccc1 family [Coniochaeta sp. 2T2.1]